MKIGATVRRKKSTKTPTHAKKNLNVTPETAATSRQSTNKEDDTSKQTVSYEKLRNQKSKNFIAELNSFMNSNYAKETSNCQSTLELSPSETGATSPLFMSVSNAKENL